MRILGQEVGKTLTEETRDHRCVVNKIKYCNTKSRPWFAFLQLEFIKAAVYRDETKSFPKEYLHSAKETYILLPKTVSEKNKLPKYASKYIQMNNNYDWPIISSAAIDEAMSDSSERKNILSQIFLEEWV